MPVALRHSFAPSRLPPAQALSAVLRGAAQNDKRRATTQDEPGGVE